MHFRLKGTEDPRGTAAQAAGGAQGSRGMPEAPGSSRTRYPDPNGTRYPDPNGAQTPQGFRITPGAQDYRGNPTPPQGPQGSVPTPPRDAQPPNRPYAPGPQPSRDSRNRMHTAAHTVQKHAAAEPLYAPNAPNVRADRVMRHELKYYITIGDYYVLRSVLRAVLKPDEYADESGNYHIRSLYFDDIYSTALSDKLAGIARRDKYRIRIYNIMDDQVKMERKSKFDQYISKDSLDITPGLAADIIAGEVMGLEQSGHELMRDVYRQVTTRGLHPVVIVDYMREAYMHPAENVRVTFDKQLRTGLWAKGTADLFDPALPTLTPLDDEMVILEVKYDDHMPDYIPRMLSAIPGRRSAISKYTLCRRYE